MQPNSRAPVPMTRHFEFDGPREARAPGDAAVSSRPDRCAAAEMAAAANLEEHLASLLSPQSFEADQYRVLRQFVDQVHAAKGLKVLAVTSPAVGDGKTTTTINLAVTLAQSPGARVLLVDADLRRPFVGTNLGLDPSGPGLVGAVLDDQVGLGTAVRRTPYGLSVLPAGTPPDNAYEVLESARTGQLLDQARNAYEYIVLDMPPVLVVPDCRLVSQWIDGFLLVVAAHRTPRKLLAETLDAMDPVKVLGIVFNGDDRPQAAYYKKYYRSYRAGPRRGRHGWWPWWPGSGRARPPKWR